MQINKSNTKRIMRVWAMLLMFGVGLVLTIGCSEEDCPTCPDVTDTIIDTVYSDTFVDTVYIDTCDNSVGSKSLVGSWGTGYWSDEDKYASITLYPNGYYIFWASDNPTVPSDSGGGVEYGTYAFDSTTSRVYVNCFVDENGDDGLADNGVDRMYDTQISVTGDVMTVAEGGDSFMLDRVISATSPIVGSWGVARYTSSFPEYVSMTFYDNGLYILWVSNDPADPNTTAGVEIGNYTYNASQNQLVITSMLRDDNGGDGFALYGNEPNPGDWTMSCTITNDILTISSGPANGWSGPRVQ